MSKDLKYIFDKDKSQILVSRDNIADEDASFMVVSNFKYKEDKALDRVYNIYTDISNIDFICAIMDAANNYDVKLEFEDNGVLIFKGHDSDLKSIQNNCGDYFSYAFTDYSGVEYVIDHMKYIDKENKYEAIERRVGIIELFEPLH